MILKDIILKNFRNYDSLKLNLNPNINIIVGNNAQGKTNLLESIYYISLSKSFRTNNDANLLMYNKNSFKIKSNILLNNDKYDTEISLIDNSKTIKINKKEIKGINEYISQLGNVILFCPSDLNIIQGMPLERRNYLNIELSQLSKNYCKILLDYNKLLKIRNDYLKKMSKNIKVDMNYFNILTGYLIEKAYLICKMRKKFINEINENSESIFFSLMKEKNFNLKYITNFDLDEDYKNNMKKKYEDILKQEIKFGSTLIGPHRDDMEFYLDKNNLKEYGSQGQKRASILCLKLSEIDLFKKYKNEMPVLLLDDVFSELDDKKKSNLIKNFNNNIQVIITTTDLKHISKKLYNDATIYEINNGNINKLEEVEKNGKK